MKQLPSSNGTAEAKRCNWKSWIFNPRKKEVWVRTKFKDATTPVKGTEPMRVLKSLILYNQSLCLPHYCVCSIRPDLDAGHSCLETVGLSTVFTSNRHFWWKPYQIFHICETQPKNGVFWVRLQTCGVEMMLLHHLHEMQDNGKTWKRFLEETWGDKHCAKCEWNRKDLKAEGGSESAASLSSFTQVRVAWRKDKVQRGQYCCLCCRCSLAKLKVLTSDQICGWQIFVYCLYLKDAY